MQYRHTRSGKVIIASIMTAIVILLCPVAVIGSLQPAQTILALFFVAALGLFYSLTVEIKDGSLICHFGLGLINRKIRLSEIQDVCNVRNPWYAGWGIRWRPGQY